MPSKWAFAVALVELTFACIIYILVLRLQLKTFKTRTNLQPLKRLLLSSVVFLIIASLPLMIVYASIIWSHSTALWVVYLAVIANGAGKVAVATLLYLVYNFKIDNT